MTHNPQQTWLGLEGVNNGNPELSRVRMISKEIIRTLGFPYLYVLTRRYTPQDRTLLPTDDEYDAIRQFEERIIDLIEEIQLGILVWTKTGSGTTAYYIYVRDIDQTTQLINNTFSQDERVDLAADEDNEWKTYQDLKNGAGLD